MADIEFSGTPEERRKQAEVLLVRMNRDLYGNGTPGIVPRIDKFITKHDTQEEERDKQHNQNRFRLNVIIAILGALAGYLVFFKGHF